MRPVGQAVKTRPFHGCNMGSIPVRVIKINPPAQAGGLFLCFRTRKRTGRRTAVRNEQSSGLFVSPREIPVRVSGRSPFPPCGLGRRTGIEQLVPAVLRTGGQKRSCGAFLERGRFSVRVTGHCSSSSGWRRFFCFRTGNCCAGDRRLRRMQGAGAGPRAAEGKPRPRGADRCGVPAPGTGRRTVCSCKAFSERAVTGHKAPNEFLKIIC